MNTEYVLSAACTACWFYGPEIKNEMKSKYQKCNHNQHGTLWASRPSSKHLTITPKDIKIEISLDIQVKRPSASLPALRMRKLLDKHNKHKVHEAPQLAWVSGTLPRFYGAENQPPSKPKAKT